MFSITPDSNLPRNRLSNFQVPISSGSSTPLVLLWAGCFSVAVFYILNQALAWLVLALYGLCFAAFLRERRRIRQITALGFDGSLYLLFGDTKVRVTSCEDVRVFPFCVLAIAKMERPQAGFIESMFLGSIALKLDRSNMSEQDFHLVSRHFSLA